MLEGDTMLNEPMDILEQFPIRKGKGQKAAFRSEVQSYAKSLGYTVQVEQGSMGAKNLVIGDPETAEYVVCAHYDTPAGMLLPNLITPCNPVTYVLYQFAIVAVFVVAALAAGVLAGLAFGSENAAMAGALIVYWGLLLMMLFGPANRSNANDNTSGVVTVLETARTMPQMHRQKVCFVLFDLEELGMVGSSSYYRSHKQAANGQIILNLDCVGDGDNILFFPTKKAKKRQDLMGRVRRIGGWFGSKQILLRDKGFSVYPSDQKSFPIGFGIAAFRSRKGVGYYCPRIHTKHDTILEQTNVNLLRAALTTLITEETGNTKENKENCNESL